MGDAHPFAEAIRSRWAMPPLNGSARLCRGPATPNEFATPDGCIAPTPDSLRPTVGSGDTFPMGDAHPFPGAILLRWAMPPLYRTAASAATQSFRTNSLRPTDASPLRL